MFLITGGKGFQLTFANGYTVSVQFGYGNYCDNKDDSSVMGCHKHGAVVSKTAEVAYWHPNINDGGLIELPETGDTVAGYLDTEQVFAFIQEVKNRPIP